MYRKGLPVFLLLSVLLVIAGYVFFLAYGADHAKRIAYYNRLDEEVAVLYKWDGVDQDITGVTVAPNSDKSEYLMVRSTGFAVTVATISGEVLLERHYLWKELPEGPLIIVIGP